MASVRHFSEADDLLKETTQWSRKDLIKELLVLIATFVSINTERTLNIKLWW